MCNRCDDTGSLSKSLDGDLNCAYCDIAEERAELDVWMKEEGIRIDSGTAWLIALHGAAHIGSVAEAA